MKKIILLATLLAVARVSDTASAQQQSFSFPNLNKPIPDGNFAGVSDLETVSSSITQIGAVEVTLDIPGQFNGDLYAYLRHDNTVSVLLNRPGRTAGNPYGYGDSGLQIALSDFAADGDVHLYQQVTVPSAGSPLTGTWQPDGRNVDPTTVLDSTPRTADLNVFNGLDPNGTWTLFLADTFTGGTNTLVSWSLEVITTPVPEPSSILPLGLGGLLLVSFVRRKLVRHQTHQLPR